MTLFGWKSVSEVITLSWPIMGLAGLIIAGLFVGAYSHNTQPAQSTLALWVSKYNPMTKFDFVQELCVGLPPTRKSKWSNKSLYSWAYHHTSVVGKRKGLENEELKATCRKMAKLAAAKWLWSGVSPMPKKHVLSVQENQDPKPVMALLPCSRVYQHCA